MPRRVSTLTSWAIIGLAAGLLTSCEQGPDIDEQLENRMMLLDLPPNQWIEYHSSKQAGWWRKGHAGLAYDSKRGHLHVFGADTHGKDWDNVVHTFVPIERRWIHRGDDAPMDSYRLNSDGIPVSGIQSIQPWAMHTFDGVEYDPVTDSLLVAGSPDHNPIRKTVPGIRKDPLWRYDLQRDEWQPIPVNNGASHPFFGAASAFDTARKEMVICSGDLWEWPAGGSEVEAAGPSLKCLHRTMAFDSRHQSLYLFGAYKRSNHVWKLERDPVTDRPERWAELTPGGDRCPAYTTAPVAFDQENGVFLLIVDDPAKGSDKAYTFLYDPTANTYQKISGATLSKVGMNFMMAWDPIHKVFFLVTGSWNSPTTVWALRLDRTQLP